MATTKQQEQKGGLTTLQRKVADLYNKGSEARGIATKLKMSPGGVYSTLRAAERKGALTRARPSRNGNSPSAGTATAKKKGARSRNSQRTKSTSATPAPLVALCDEFTERLQAEAKSRVERLNAVSARLDELAKVRDELTQEQAVLQAEVGEIEKVRKGLPSS